MTATEVYMDEGATPISEALQPCVCDLLTAGETKIGEIGASLSKTA
jgi:hypothetical protein